MRIIAIDPGYGRMGVAIIEESLPAGRQDKKPKLLFSKCLETPAGENFPARLLGLVKKFSQLTKKWQPQALAIEKLYFTKNVKTGIEVAQARGALINELARCQISIEEFTPSEIKKAVTGYGNSDKKGVAKMVAKILRMESVKGYDDASDALAVAITASQKREWA